MRHALQCDGDVKYNNKELKVINSTAQSNSGWELSDIDTYTHTKQISDQNYNIL